MPNARAYCPRRSAISALTSISSLEPPEIGWSGKVKWQSDKTASFAGMLRMSFTCENHSFFATCRMRKSVEDAQDRKLWLWSPCHKRSGIETEAKICNRCLFKLSDRKSDDITTEFCKQSAATCLPR